MATLAELQEEVVRQSTRRLEAENELTEMEQRWRAELKENNLLKSQNAEMQAEMNLCRSEVADLSTSLLDQANRKVEEANRRAQMVVDESQEVIASQAAELQALKEMLELLDTSNTSNAESINSMSVKPNSGNGFRNAGRSSSQRRAAVREMAVNGRPNEDNVLDLDAYCSPLRPILRTDLKDFTDFVAIWGCEAQHTQGRFAKLETPAWRKPRYVQRVISEDIETTLRLDRSPHMSWLTCRAFLAGVLDQSITLEPVSARELSWSLRPSHPFILCGENRSQSVYARSYWARLTNDSEPIVLDLTCVTKARLACEFIAFLRNITKRPPADHDAHVRAWLQCNSMREQLFWVRTGGFYTESEEKMSQLLELLEMGDSERSSEVQIPSLPTRPGRVTESSDNDNINSDETKEGISENAIKQSISDIAGDSEQLRKDSEDIDPLDTGSNNEVELDEKIESKQIDENNEPNDSNEENEPEEPDSVTTVSTETSQHKLPNPIPVSPVQLPDNNF